MNETESKIINNKNANVETGSKRNLNKLDLSKLQIEAEDNINENNINYNNNHIAKSSISSNENNTITYLEERKITSKNNNNNLGVNIIHNDYLCNENEEKQSLNKIEFSNEKESQNKSADCNNSANLKNAILDANIKNLILNKNRNSKQKSKDFGNLSSVKSENFQSNKNYNSVKVIKKSQNENNILNPNYTLLESLEYKLYGTNKITNANNTSLTKCSKNKLPLINQEKFLSYIPKTRSIVKNNEFDYYNTYKPHKNTVNHSTNVASSKMIDNEEKLNEDTILNNNLNNSNLHEKRMNLLFTYSILKKKYSQALSELNTVERTFKETFIETINKLKSKSDFLNKIIFENDSPINSPSFEAIKNLKAAFSKSAVSYIEDANNINNNARKSIKNEILIYDNNNFNTMIPDQLVTKEIFKAQEQKKNIQQINAVNNILLEIENSLVNKQQISEFLVEFEDSYINLVLFLIKKINKLTNESDTKDKEISDLNKNNKILNISVSNLEKYIQENDIDYNSNINTLFKSKAEKEKKLKEREWKKEYIKNFCNEKEISELKRLVDYYKEMEIENSRLIKRITELEGKHQSQILNVREDNNRINFKLEVSKGDLLSKNLEIEKLNVKILSLEKEITNLSRKVIIEIKNRKMIECKLNETTRCLQMSNEEAMTYYCMYINSREINGVQESHSKRDFGFNNFTSSKNSVSQIEEDDLINEKERNKLKDKEKAKEKYNNKRFEKEGDNKFKAMRIEESDKEFDSKNSTKERLAKQPNEKEEDVNLRIKYLQNQLKTENNKTISS